MTVKPIPGKGIEARQHVPLNYASFSLRNLSGGVETNRDGVIQIELVGTCDKKGRGYYWPGADDAVLLALAELIVEISSVRKIKMVAPAFKSYPSSYGSNGVRMSGYTFRRYIGWLGHQHVPENVHGDPGDFPWTRMLRLYAEAHKAKPKPPAPPQSPAPKPNSHASKPKPPAKVLPGVITKYWQIKNPRMRGLEVLSIRRATKAAKPLWPVYDNSAARAVVDFQKKHGLTPDGVVGPKTVAKMGLVWKG